MHCYFYCTAVQCSAVPGFVRLYEPHFQTLMPVIKHLLTTQAAAQALAKAGECNNNLISYSSAHPFPEMKYCPQTKQSSQHSNNVGPLVVHKFDEHNAELVLTKHDHESNLCGSLDPALHLFPSFPTSTEICGLCLASFTSCSHMVHILPAYFQ